MKHLTTIVLALGLFSNISIAAPTAIEKFNKADTNNDGVLTSTEYYTDMSRKMASKASEGKSMKGVSTAPQFDHVDKNNNGEITFEEFDTFHAVRMKQMEKIKNTTEGSGKGMQLFKQYDTNNDGCIDKNEFSKLYKSNSK